MWVKSASLKVSPGYFQMSHWSNSKCVSDQASCLAASGAAQAPLWPAGYRLVVSKRYMGFQKCISFLTQKIWYALEFFRLVVRAAAVLDGWQLHSIWERWHPRPLLHGHWISSTGKSAFSYLVQQNTIFKKHLQNQDRLMSTFCRWILQAYLPQSCP